MRKITTIIIITSAVASGGSIEKPTKT